MQEILCASCLGIATRFQRAVLLFGSADSGKSVLLKIIGSMFPEEAKCSVSFDRMADTSYVTALNNKIINIVGELSKYKIIEGSVFKSVVAGEVISGRYLFNEVFNLIPKAAHWAASNHLPKSNDSSHGFVRRWLIFEFDRPVPERKKDVNLADKIIAREIEAIFAWCLSARTRVVSDKAQLTIPTSSRLKEDLVYLNINPVKHFLTKDEALAYSPDFRIPEHELYARFRYFMFQTMGIRKIQSMPEFNSMVSEVANSFSIGVGKDKSITYYSGIKVID